MNIIKSDFPYEEIKNSEGNMFFSWRDASIAGYPDNQIWSVVEDDNDTITYGPPHHYVNVLGYIATAETHDGQTYYEENISDVPDLESMVDELLVLREKNIEGPLVDTFYYNGVQYKVTINEYSDDDDDDDEPIEEELEAIHGRLGQG